LVTVKGRSVIAKGRLVTVTVTRSVEDLVDSEAGEVDVEEDEAE
jgi:hypothetical protein